MSPISGPVADVLIAKKAAVSQQIDVAVAGKRIEQTEKSGHAMVSLIENAVLIQQQLAEGRLDVRV